LEFPLLMPRLVDRTTKLGVITHMRSIFGGQPRHCICKKNV